MNPVELYDDKFFKILWNEADRVIGIDWKETTASMTDEDFKGELELFVGRVEEKKARGIIIDVKHFRHKLGPGMQEWRVKNISSRYSAAGVTRFAFVVPGDRPVPPMMNQSSPGEDFPTRAFHSADEAICWLAAPA